MIRPIRLVTLAVLVVRRLLEELVLGGIGPLYGGRKPAGSAGKPPGPVG